MGKGGLGVGMACTTGAWLTREEGVAYTRGRGLRRKRRGFVLRGRGLIQSTFDVCGASLWDVGGDRDWGRGLRCWAWSTQEGAWLCVKGGVAYSQALRLSIGLCCGEWGGVGGWEAWLERKGRGLRARACPKPEGGVALC